MEMPAGGRSGAPQGGWLRGRLRRCPWKPRYVGLPWQSREGKKRTQEPQHLGEMESGQGEATVCLLSEPGSLRSGCPREGGAEARLIRD